MDLSALTLTGLPDDPVTDFAVQVIERAKRPVTDLDELDQYTSGEFVQLACRRHIEDLGRDDLYFNADQSARIIDFFPDCLQHYKGQYVGKPFILNPWQEFIAGSLYGWYRVEDDERRYRTAYIETGKGSGKTPLGSGFSIYHTLADHQPKAQAYVIAATSDQALIAMRDVTNMVKVNPDLNDRFRIVGGDIRPESVHRLGEGSFIERKSTPPEGRGASGFSVSFLLVDEYHEHLKSDTYDMYAAGVKARKNPLVLIITNAGTEMTSPCGREHDYAIEVVRRATGGQPDVHDAYFSFVCNLDKDNDYRSKCYWPKTNPSLPGPPGVRYVEEELNRLLRQGKKTTAERLLFCKWINSVNGWLETDAWKSIEVDKISQRVTHETPAYLCFDVGQKKDFMAANIIFDTSTAKRESYEAMAKVWTPHDTLLERSKNDRAPYHEWMEKGYLVSVPGSILGFDDIIQWLIEMIGKYNVQGLTFDPYKATEIKRGLEEAHIQMTNNAFRSGLLTVPHPQGFLPNRRPKEGKPKPGELYLWMNNGMSEIERWVFDKIFHFQHNPLMNMAVAGGAVKPDPRGTSRMIVKQSETHSRIDPLVALTMGAGFASEVKAIRKKLSGGVAVPLVH